VLFEDAFQSARSGAGIVSVDLVVQGPEIENLQDLGLVARALEGAVADNLGEIEQGAGDRCDSDAVDHGDVAGGEGGGAMDVDAWVTSRGPLRDRHVDFRLVGASESMKRRSGAVREGCAGAAGENGANEETLAAEEFAGDEGVDGVVDAVEPAGVDPVAGPRLRQTAFAELIERHDAVLTQGEPDHRAAQRRLDV
jgi:hypothetical protein